MYALNTITGLNKIEFDVLKQAEFIVTSNKEKLKTLGQNRQQNKTKKRKFKKNRSSITCDNLNKFKQTVNTKDTGNLQTRHTKRNTSHLSSLRKTIFVQPKQSNTRYSFKRTEYPTVNIFHVSRDRKIRRQAILQQNLILIHNLKTNAKRHNEMRKTITNEVKEYLSRRASIRKSLLPSEIKQYKRQLAYSSLSNRSQKSKTANSSKRKVIKNIDC